VLYRFEVPINRNANFWKLWHKESKFLKFLSKSHFSTTDLCCHGNEIWDKIGYIFVRVNDMCVIAAITGGFWRWTIKCCQSHFHSNEIWNKIGYNSACVKNICEIFLSIWGFSEVRQQMVPVEFTPTDPGCNENEILHKIGYNSTYVRNISKILPSNKVF